MFSLHTVSYQMSHQMSVGGGWKLAADSMNMWILFICIQTVSLFIFNKSKSQKEALDFTGVIR